MYNLKENYFLKKWYIYINNKTFNGMYKVKKKEKIKSR